MAANVTLDLLDHVRIASPCPMRWEDMDGDGAVRHCRRCDLDVHNLSAMTREQAETLLRTHEGRLCAGFYRRADGTILTEDCPVGLRALRRKTRRAVARLVAALGLLVTGGVALSADRDGDRRLRAHQPFLSFCEWIAPTPAPPPPVGAFIAGDIALPPGVGVGAPGACGAGEEPGAADDGGQVG